MKKFLLLLLALTLSLGLFACGDNDGGETEDNKTPVEEVDLSKGVQTVAPYKIYNEDETELDGKDYESMFTAIRIAGAASSSKNKTYVLDGNGLKIYQRQSNTKYWCFRGTTFYGSMPKAEAEKWAANYTDCYVMNGQGTGYVICGTKYYEGSDLSNDIPLELFSGGYNYMFSTHGRIESDEWVKKGWGYLECYVRLSEVEYVPTKDGDGWNAYIFINAKAHNHSDLGLICGVDPSDNTKANLRLFRNCSAPEHVTELQKYGPSFTVLQSGTNVTRLTYDPTKGVYTGGDDLFFQCWQGTDGFILHITNLTTGQVFKIEEIHPGINADQEQYLRFLVSASYCPVVDTIWNARCGASLRNVVYDGINIARWNENEEYTESMYEEFYPDSNMSYGFSQAADCASMIFGKYEDGRKYISMSCYYDGGEHFNK